MPPIAIVSFCVGSFRSPLPRCYSGIGNISMFYETLGMHSVYESNNKNVQEDAFFAQTVILGVIRRSAKCHIFYVIS